MSSLYTRRATYTRNEIRKNFLEMLKNSPPEKISVTDLIKKTDISRGTFYLHYADIPALWDDIQQLVYDAHSEWLDTFFDTNKADDLDSHTKYMYQYQNLIHNEVIPQCLQDKVNQAFYDQIKKLIAHYQIYSEEEIDRLCTFIIGGIQASEKREKNSSKSNFIAKVIHALSSWNIREVILPDDE